VPGGPQHDDLDVRPDARTPPSSPPPGTPPLGSLGDVGEPDGERVQRSPHVRDVGLVEVALQADAVLDVLAGDGLDLLELGEVLGRQRGAGSPGCSMVLNSFMKRTWPHP
jgi:hypothetical protein